MSYFMHKYIPLHVGTPGWQFAPVPSWGVNPANAGPRRVGIGATCASCGSAGCAGCGSAGCAGCGSAGCAGCGATEEEKYKTVTWGHVAGAAAIGLIAGLLVGYAAGKSAQTKKTRRYSRNRSRIWKPNPSRKITRIRGPRGGLTTASRSRLPSSSFVDPEHRTWPINDRYHAIKALQYAKWPQHASRRVEVLDAVGRKWGHDPVVREKMREYFPRSADRYIRRAA
jgi:hypothetical protein